MIHGFGVIPASPEEASHDEEHNPIGGLLVGVSALPRLTSLDQTPHLDFVPDQGPTNSCVAQWFSSAIYLAGQAQRQPVKRPSRRWSYAVARWMRSPRSELLDLGSSARLMCMGSEKHGIVAEERLPFEPAHINEPPPFDVDIAGADALFSSWHRSSNDNDLLVMALEANHFPGIAIAVHDNFLDWGATSDAYREVAGKFRGYHMLTIVGFRTNADGTIDFLVLNSYGTGWGNGGFIWLSGAFVASSYTFDRHVVTAAPRSR